MRYLRLSATVAFVLLILTGPVRAASINDFVNYSFLDNNNSTVLPGLLHVPAGYAANPAMPRPLILFLHGAGESGTNNRSQINGNIDNLLAAAKARDAFLYAPQTNIGWGNAARLANAMTMIDRAIVERNVDPNRIYVTGLSMGGGGTWNFLNQFPERVAASAPICGVGPTSSFVLGNVLNEPIWAFHGRFDSTVLATVTRNIINSFLVAEGLPLPTYPPLNTFGPHVQYDFPPLDLHYTDMRGSHGIWPEVYNNAAMYDWLFAHGVVPEPSSLFLAGLVLVAVCASRCRTPQLQ
jgi:predicted peptidase